MFKINKYFVFILAVFSSANAIEVPLLELKEHAAALNIEGSNILGFYRPINHGQTLL